jgi:hypothetical protein
LQYQYFTIEFTFNSDDIYIQKKHILEQKEVRKKTWNNPVAEPGIILSLGAILTVNAQMFIGLRFFGSGFN